MWPENLIPVNNTYPCDVTSPRANQRPGVVQSQWGNDVSNDRAAVPESDRPAQPIHPAPPAHPQPAK